LDVALNTFGRSLTYTHDLTDPFSEETLDHITQSLRHVEEFLSLDYWIDSTLQLISRWSKLRVVKIQGLFQDSTAALQHLFAQAPHIQVLYLQDMVDWYEPQGIKAALSQLSQLQELHIKEVGYANMSANLLRQVIQVCPALEKLTLETGIDGQYYDWRHEPDVVLRYSGKVREIKSFFKGLPHIKTRLISQEPSASSFLD
jgi:hypothetical protein